MVTKTQAIKNLLLAKAPQDLAKWYDYGMECQVNVAQDGGTRVDNEYKGKSWHGWTDGATTWKSFRIPYKAATEPEYEDRNITFDLAAHAEGIGMTGWNWERKESLWVAYDFDSLIGHVKGLTAGELEEIINKAKDIPWVTLRNSTSGKGIHLYVYLNNVSTENHTEHAALGRAILAKLSAIACYDFKAKVDSCGGNMWVWHRKATNSKSLTLIKEGEKLYDIPPNWRDHLIVVRGKSYRTLPKNIQETEEDDFDQLTNKRLKVKLDTIHKKLISWFEESDALWWWDQDRHMLVSHTIHFKEAFDAIKNLKGIFDTVARGKERGQDHNCFAFPMSNGSWSVRRFTRGCQEHPSWQQDEGGWTQCYFNREPDLKIAARSYGGIELPAGGFQFKEAEVAAQAAMKLGASVELPRAIGSRDTTLKEHKDGRLVMTIKHKTEDGKLLDDWAIKGGYWTRIFDVNKHFRKEIELGSSDEMVRHIVSTSLKDAGWSLHSSDGWADEPMNHVKLFLKSNGYTLKEIDPMLGSAISQPWKLVNKPFQAEYPGNREWNRKAAQLRYIPNADLDNLKFPHWEMILNHLGENLTTALEDNVWAKANGIQTGAEYLKLWIASMFQKPLDPLPYLFLFSKSQNTGKSMLHEALQLLMTNGYQLAANALINPQNFNGEIENAVLCVVEEVDLQKSKTAYNRIKEWVTARKISIHTKGETPFLLDNSTHWIQCANDESACPIFPGDSRITVIRVNDLDPLVQIPKKKLIEQLEQEASDFLASILNLDIPESTDRLAVPPVQTTEKHNLENMHKTHLEMFLDERCFDCKGNLITFKEFYEAFFAWLPIEDRDTWTKHKVSSQLPSKYPKGTHTNNAMKIANLSLNVKGEEQDINWRVTSQGRLTNG